MQHSKNSVEFEEPSEDGTAENRSVPYIIKNRTIRNMRPDTMKAENPENDEAGLMNMRPGSLSSIFS